MTVGQHCDAKDQYLLMQRATGWVIGGKVVIEGASFTDGTAMTILGRESAEMFDVPPELEAELSLAVAEADRGEFMSAAELLKRLRRIS